MLAEIFLRHREAKGRMEALMEARRLIESRLESMTAEELIAEIDRLIEEAQNKRGKRGK